MTINKCLCGGEAKLVGHHVVCQTCGKRTTVYMNWEDAIIVWNQMNEEKLP